jgi:lipopolysaccharide export LptBFGC system permease protein LptF
MAECCEGKKSLWCGILFIVIGLGLILHNLGKLPALIATWWPLLLVLLGIKCLVKRGGTPSSSAKT